MKPDGIMPKQSLNDQSIKLQVILFLRDEETLLFASS